jgi:hypothetical protein
VGSFLIGTGVTLVTFYIALIYGSIAIGLIGFAELVDHPYHHQFPL